MTHILLYWNHICVLYRQEKTFLQELARRLHREDIKLEVRFFDLGHLEHMSEYLARPGAVLPDPIVSVGLEVFGDRAIFSRMGPELYPTADWVSLRGSPTLDAMRRGDKLLPVAATPLIYYTRELGICEQMRLPDWDGLTFSGINNSTVETVVKVVWETWGREATSGLLDRSFVTDIPIGAFQTVRQGQARTALVPSLYALRADGQSTSLRMPQEGPVLIPSYLYTRTPAPEQAARRVAEGILYRELCDSYVSNGGLILSPACTQLRSGQEGERVCCPSAVWLDTLARDDFYGLYCNKLPTTTDPIQ